MSNKDYFAVVVRYEHALRKTNNWVLDKCFKAVVNSWRALMNESSLDESFWSIDVGALEVKVMKPWKGSGSYLGKF